LTDFTGYLLRRAFARSMYCARNCIPEDSGVRELAVLAVLNERGQLSQRELADFMRINPTIMVKLVDSLQSKGWVMRHRNPADRRSNALELTMSGVKAMRSLRTDLDRGEAELTAPLTQAEKQRLNRRLQQLLIDDPAARIESLAKQTTYLIALAHQAQRTRATERLRPLGVHPRDFGVLSILASEQPCSQQHLASRLGISPPAVLPFVEALEREGLVKRERRSDDRRAYDVTLTDRGRKALIRARETATRLQSELVDQLGPRADQELRKLLRKLIDV
jgi:DNA-binding MarR family transcriptional regulator